MKSKFSKIYHEGGSRGGTGKKNLRSNRRDTKSKLQEFDSETSDFTSMGKLHSVKGYGDRKERSGNHGVIKRFLSSKVGQKWDDVFSEISENISKKSSNCCMTWDDINYLVHTKTYIEGKTIMTGRYAPSPVEDKYWETFYVHPETGILCHTKKTAKKKRNNDVSYFKNDKNSLIQYHKINDIWYQVNFEHLKGDAAKEDYSHVNNEWQDNRILINILTQNKIYHYRSNTARICKDTFGALIIPVSKKQLNSKEIKRFIKN